MQDVAGKVAFITGGASGIGLGMARAFSSAGMKVVIADVEQSALDAVQAEFEKSNADILTLKVDVTDRDAMEQAAQAAEDAFGKVHVVCNNAGVAVAGTLDSMSYEDWDWVNGVNIGGVINGLQAFVNRIKSHGEGGHIVNTASMAGVSSIPGLGVYNAGKWAVVAMSETLRLELAEQDIGVSVLCPGVVNTNIFNSGRNRPEDLTGETDTSDLSGTVTGPDDEPDTSALAEADSAVVDPANILDPDVVGEMVLAGIQANDSHIFTHPELEMMSSARFEQMTSQFARWRAYREEHGI